MKTSKMAKILSAILALAVILCSLPFALGVTVSAEGTTTVDYSAMANLPKPSIADYTDTFGMHDGVGLRVKDGALIPDGDWFWQLDYIDKYVDATPAYAIYDVTPNTEFVADFSTTTDISAMKFYASENMVDWYLLGTAGDEKTVTVNLPYYANYLKIAWPLGANEKNGILSVDYTKPEADANEIVINYKKATTGTSTMVGSGLNDVNVLNNRGVWQSNGIELNDKGVLVPDWTRLNNATSANSFDGYVTYKVHPETRFSMTVSTAKNIDSSGKAHFPFDGVAQKLGYENPAQWNLEIYVSEDNVNFTRLDEVALRTMTARYPNNIASHGNAYRTTEYNFIVPEGMAYVKAKFPMTQNLSTVKDSEGNPVMGGCGNDIFSINKVEFTRFKYDYANLGTNDYYIDKTISADTVADFGAIEYGGGLKQVKNGFTTDWTWQYNNGHAGTNIVYAVEPGTPFFAGFKIEYLPNLSDYLSVKDNYTIKLQGYNGSAWVDAADLVVTADNTANVYYSASISAEDNIYTKVKVLWPARANGSQVGADCLALQEVAFTAPQTKVYDFNQCTDIATLKTDFGVLDYTTGEGNTVPMVSGKSGNTRYLFVNGNTLNSQGHEGAFKKAYFTYKVAAGSKFKVYFDKNAWYADVEKWSDESFNIKAYSSATDTFETVTEHAITYSDASNNFEIEFDVPFGEEYIKVEFPQTCKVSSTKSGNDMFRIKKVEITKADLEIDGIFIAQEPSTVSYYKGEAVKTDGFALGLTFSNGEERAIDYGFTVSNDYDSLTLGEQEIQVDYDNYMTSFIVNFYVYDGDFNCDKNVNMLDLIRLKKIAVSAGVSDGADADIDGSGAVDGGDLTRMKKFILGASEAV